VFTWGEPGLLARRGLLDLLDRAGAVAGLAGARDVHRERRQQHADSYGAQDQTPRWDEVGLAVDQPEVHEHERGIRERGARMRTVRVIEITEGDSDASGQLNADPKVIDVADLTKQLASRKDRGDHGHDDHIEESFVIFFGLGHVNSLLLCPPMERCSSSYII